MNSPVKSQVAWPAAKVELWAIDRLSANPRNARIHGEEQIEQLRASLREFGWTMPVLVRENGMLIAGHGRLEAARLEGLTEVPTIVARGWSDAQCQAYAIADNRLTEASEWSDELLRLELGDLRAAGFDLTLTGFGQAEIDDLLQIDANLDGDPDEVPEPPNDPISRPGDIWICGEHRVLCGDATVLSDVEKVLDGELADMAFTDPPYNVDYGKSAQDGNRAKRGSKRRPILNDALGEEFGVLLYDTSVNILTVTKGAVYICMSTYEIGKLQKAFKDAGGRVSTFVIWAKNTFTLGRSDYQRQYEPILYGWKEGAEHFWCGARDQGDVWFVDKPVKNDLHPTMKPVALVERAIRNSSKSRDVVIDLFGGSGTTMIAAERAGRRARLIELDPKYVDVIVQRWQDITGGRAVHAATGQPFETPQAVM
ncbi:site-specific DNA-methyltransferase [Bradyrhizobium sp. HKCCYLRH3095]|uniref:site-specific DNA-methyltransferase n=1 Tax=Bradyrhizobium sp. HKCCYLRH3095 TaxID=3420765 RepID=UPI003EBDECD7